MGIWIWGQPWGNGRVRRGAGRRGAGVPAAYCVSVSLLGALR